MESLQVTLGRFLMQVFVLLPVFLIAFFILTLVLFRRAPEGSELRRRRRFWFFLLHRLHLIKNPCPQAGIF